MKYFKSFLFLFFICCFNTVFSQKIYQYESKEAKLLFFDKKISQYVPHVIWEHRLGLQRHDHLWHDSTAPFSLHYHPEQTYLYLTDWNDDGNGGASVIPNNFITISMAPLSNTYDIAPAVERYWHLSSHELTHIYNTDKYTRRDLRWRKFFGAKIPTDGEAPISTIWSYFSTPRWYNPRWYQEGIACFVETSMDGGVGRALGTYDEMYFRALIAENKPIFSAVGLETEGTAADFQIGATSYLYGTRFVNYLAYRYGTDSLFRFYNRTEDSKRNFAAQFKKVYGKRLTNVWNEWREYEAQHQQRNLEIIKQEPLTPLTPLYKKAMGSVGTPIYDAENQRLYLAANYRGNFAHISYIDLKTGKEKILRTIDGAMLYNTTYLTFDKRRNRLIYNIHNADYRGIEIIDANTGKRLDRLNFQRVSNLAYDNANDLLYGILSHNGTNNLVRYSANLNSEEILYTFPFGQSINYLNISEKGDRILAMLTKPNGNNALILFSVKGLEMSNLRYEEVMEIENINLINFCFADNDSTLIGSSNYTGVQNIWSIDLTTKEMSLLSNVTTGLYAPVPYTPDSLIALSYESGGFRPVKLERQVITDATPIDLLGQLVYDQNPTLELLSEKDTVRREYGDIYNNITEYRPIKEMRFAGAFPNLTGFRDHKAFNNVTPVLGYQLLFQDPAGLNVLKMQLGISPWSNNPIEQQFHAQLDWNFWGWKFTAAYNPTYFYDLVGPERQSRSGINLGVSYTRSYILLSPLKWKWSISADVYGMMDALPLFQNVESPVSSMQTLCGTIGVSKLRKSLGAVTEESGYDLKLEAYSYFALIDKTYSAFPEITLQADKGFLLPVGHNNAFWLRSAIGQNFGDPASAFGNQYFGGFKNNYLTNQDYLRFREVKTFPGAQINEIKARSFVKFLGEIDFTPIRLKNAGWSDFYLNHLFFNLFGSDLLVNPWGTQPFQNYVNVGVQLNIEVVLFSYMKTTWSVGFAQMFGPEGKRSNELMFSLKLL